MTDVDRIAEAQAMYGSAVADLHRPLILEREGQPLAVVISFEEYQRLRAIEVDDAMRRDVNWARLSEMLAAVHSRPSSHTPAEIEAEITAARAEVRQERRGRERGR